MEMHPYQIPWMIWRWGGYMWDRFDSPAVFYQRHPTFLLPSLYLCPLAFAGSLSLSSPTTPLSTTGEAMADTASSSYVCSVTGNAYG